MDQLEIKVAPALGCLYKDQSPTKVLYGGRGGAKSTGCAEALLAQGMESPLRILCVREIQKSITLSVYSLLKDKIAYHGLEAFYKVKNDTIVGANGTQFFFEGLQNHTVDSLKSIERINRCWVEEAHNVTNKSWEILIPSLFRTEDCQLWVTFNTRRVTDPTYIRFVQNADENTLVRKLSWRDNPWFPEGMNRERLKLLKDDPEAYAHVWEGEPDTRFDGSVYARWVDNIFKNNRAVDGLYDPELPVYTAWDLGWSDSTAIIFWQQSLDETRVIDCYESFNEDIPHYAKVVLDKPYKYASHYMPRDAANKLLAAGGRSIAEIARENGLDVSIVPETTHAQRIEAARKLLGIMYIDKGETIDLVNALMNYQFKYNEDLKVFSTKPVHDWSSHYSTAFELLARVVRDERPKEEIDKKGIFTYKGVEGGNKIVAQIDMKSYLRKKARARNED